MSAGHLGHLACGMSSNFLNPDDAGPTPTLVVSADATSPASEVVEGASISYAFSVIVGGASQTNVVAILRLDPSTLPGGGAGFAANDATMSANEVYAPAYSVVYDGVVSSKFQWTCTYVGTHVVGTSNLYIGSNWAASRVNAGTFDVYNQPQTLSGSVAATSTEVGASTPTLASFGVTHIDTAELTASITEPSDPITVGVSAAFVSTNTMSGYRDQSSITCTITVTPSAGASINSPTTDYDNTWVAGSWSSIGGGAYACTYTIAGPITKATYGGGVDLTQIGWSVTATAAGTLTTTIVISSTQCTSGTGDTETTAVVAASPPAYVSAGTAASGTGALTPGGTGASGNDIEILCVNNTYINPGAATLSSAQGFVAITGGTVSSGSYSSIYSRCTLFWRRGGGSDPTVADNGEFNCARIYKFSGCVTSGNPWDVVSSEGDVSGDSSFSVTGATTTGANRLVCVFGVAFTGGATSIASWANSDLGSVTERDDTSYLVSSDYVHMALTTGTKSSAGAYGATTATRSGGAYYVTAAVTVALKP